MSQRTGFWMWHGSKWEVIWLTLRLKVLLLNFMSFPFPLFKFWRISSLSCVSLKCTRIPTGNGTSFLCNSSLLFLRLAYPYPVLFLLRERSSKRALESFWYNILCSFTILLSSPQQNNILILLLLIYLFNKQFAKTDRNIFK